ncbi:YtxH domain-containing protein [Flagellimonas aequoris]|uniref:YtxH domain-containing protein n=1 Tax=Flagellimonas aequoris TaxID=2306997 RepID=A0A418N6X9_9FLAO|nr:YtxH domain-containing protein [Allomuricauda aequoris]RIV70590.1 YtxH domain-containing protein [Allomuricauda aequoris]TXK02021.1 YtxH domain-containing protein [Allomuricauda aequoris]
MRKSISLLVLFMAMAFTMSMNSCRETKEDKAEEAIEDVKDGVEEAGDEIEDAADDVGDKIEEVVEKDSI